MKNDAPTILNHKDEAALWQAAEALARRAQLPLLDLCSHPAGLRVPAELSLSLCERLQRGLSTDGRMVRLPMSPDRAEYVRQQLEQHLARR
jgi:hypothetical protein